MHLGTLRALIGLMALTLLALPASAQAQSLAADEFRVTLLGTGSPAPIIKRFGPGVLLQPGGKTLLIDSGRGVTQRLLQAGVTLCKVDALFLTDLHSGHVVGIPDLWLTGWLLASCAQRQGPSWSMARWARRA
jgi:ribonuclease Z